MMRKHLALILALACASAHAETAIKCRPFEISHSATMSPSIFGVNKTGVWLAYMCAGTKILIVQRWDALTAAQALDVLTWIKTTKDPADLRALVAKYRTGDPWTTLSLVEVWAPDKARIEALK
jgi:hypothetical protein